MTISGIAFGYLYQKLREVNIKSFFFQLFISSLRAFRGAGSKIYFYYGIRKNHGTHVAAVRHESRHLPEKALALKQCRPYLRQWRQP